MYQIQYHNLVLKKDLRNIPKNDVVKIFKAIDKKLTSNPLIFGKPLAGDLKGFYRLRVGFYRVIYGVDGDRIIVFVLNVGLRKDLIVYIEVAKRLKLIK